VLNDDHRRNREDVTDALNALPGWGVVEWASSLLSASMVEGCSARRATCGNPPHRLSRWSAKPQSAGKPISGI
jgi:hypothetical protein